MGLPSDLQFSQGSLQDYVDCPWRFYLRHVRRLAWPAIVAEPALEHERHLQQGRDFHLLVHQHELGIETEQLSAVVTDVNMRRWWLNYLETGPGEIPEVHYPEIVLSTPVGGFRLVAKYDLLAVDPGRHATILDWKTYRTRSGRRWLAERLQTRVYPYVLARAVSHLNEGQPLEPDGAYLSSLVEEIEGLSEDQFDRTADKDRCRFCRYRSLCQRGVRAGDFREELQDWDVEQDEEILLDCEQAAEIEY